MQPFGRNRYGPKIGWGLCPFGEGELGPHLTQWGQGRGLYLHAKFHLDPSKRLATVYERHRQDRQDRQTNRQRSHSIGQTVLQTVAPKCYGVEWTEVEQDGPLCATHHMSGITAVFLR